jgi:ATP-binding cassette, subfamily B, bacterial PglK
MYKSNIYKNIWSLLEKKDRSELVAIFFLTLLMVFLEMIGISALIPIMNLFSINEETISNNFFIEFINEFLSNNNISNNMIVIAFVSIFSLKTAISFLYYYWHSSFSSRLIARLSKKLLGLYLARPLEFHLQKNSAELIRNTFSEIGTFVGAGIQPIMTIAVELLVMIGLAVILFLVNPTGTVLILSSLILLSFAIFFFIKPFLYRWGKRREAADGKRIQYINQGLGGVKEILIHSKEKYFLKQYSVVNDISAQSAMKFNAFQHLPRLLIELLIIIGFSVYVWLFVTGSSSDVGVDIVYVGVFLVVILRILPSVNRILSSLQLIRYGLPYVETLYKDLGYKPDHHRSTASNAKLSFRKVIDIHNISYRYPERDNTINELTLQIKAGDRVALIGESGAGKSTLINIILGLLQPSSGEIEVDGINIYDNLKGWQANLGYVSQDIYLLDDTITNNVALWIKDEDINMNQVKESVKLAALDDLVGNLPEGLSTIIGENGVRFSGGERQRLGIARALYAQPSVLILDEITSALDSETEKRVMDSIYSLDSSITIIIITHKHSSAYGCNKILRVENGTINIG